MNIIYALIAGCALAMIAGVAIWFAIVQAKARGRAEAEAEINREEANRVQEQGSIIAEHREPADASRRLHDGTF